MQQQRASHDSFEVVAGKPVEDVEVAGIVVDGGPFSDRDTVVDGDPFVVGGIEDKVELAVGPVWLDKGSDVLEVVLGRDLLVLVVDSKTF